MIKPTLWPTMAYYKKKEGETVKDYESIAAALYDGGWRAEDKDQLKAEYDLTDDDVERIVDLLATYEA